MFFTLSLAGLLHFELHPDLINLTLLSHLTQIASLTERTSKTGVNISLFHSRSHIISTIPYEGIKFFKNTRKSTLDSQTMKSHVLYVSKCYYESDEGVMDLGVGDRVKAR